MKKRILLLISISLIVSFVFVYFHEPSHVKVGEAAPSFSLKSHSGFVYSLELLKGKIVIVNFWASWCPPCLKEMPSLEALYQKFKKEELVVLAINLDEASSAKEKINLFLTKSKTTFPILLEDLQVDVAGLYGVHQLPKTFIINREGILIKKVSGAVDWMANEHLRVIKDILKIKSDF